jgi:hypothetical protein
MTGSEKALVASSGRQVVAQEPGTNPGLFAFLDPARQWFDERRLKRALVREFRAARDFQSNGLPAGSEQYRMLHRRCCAAVARTAGKWNRPLAEASLDVPALYGLEKLAYPERTSPLGRALIALLAVLLAAVAIGAFTGTMAGVHAAIAGKIGG